MAFQVGSGTQWADLHESILASNFFFLPNRPSKKRDSSEDWTRIARISMRIGEEDAIRASLAKYFKNRHSSRESIHANLRNVGVRIAGPLRSTISPFTFKD